MQEEISFGVWLRKQRRALDLSRQAFAAQVGCAEVTLRRIEAGTLKPSKELAGILLEKLDAPELERPQWIAFARGLSGLPLSSSPSSKPITNLPAPLSTFIGRDKEKLDVIRLLTKHRLVTLIGSGGVGKTRLSVKVGEQILRDYLDGVWLVELAPILDPFLVPHTMALTLGLRDDPKRSVIDRLCDYLRQKRILLLIDNCEHVLVACAQLIDTVLKSCPDLKILATSREPLNITGEAIYRVPSLRLPKLQQILDTFRNYESIQLFEERAQLVQFDFSLTLENAASVAQICQRIDGIPLAIELAAARVNMLSTEQIAARLNESLSVLTSGSRATLPRHQTLRGSIDWSWNLLSEPEQILLRRLSIFAGGWTLEAAESVCAENGIEPRQVMEIMTQLVTKSLIVSTQEYDSARRYHMLEMIRQFAHEKLQETGDMDEIRDRHLDWMIAWSEEMGKKLSGRDHVAVLKTADLEVDNVRSVIHWALISGKAELAMGVFLALRQYWDGYQPYEESRRWLEKGISFSEQLSMTTLAKTFCERSALAFRQNDAESGNLYANKALTLANQMDDRYITAFALQVLGLAQILRSEYVEAEVSLQRSYALYKDLERISDLIMTVIDQALAITYQGDLHRANELLENHMSLMDRLDTLSTKAHLLLVVGGVKVALGDWQLATSRLKDCLRLSRQLNNAFFIGNGLILLAGAAIGGNNPMQAARLYGAGEVVHESIGAIMDPGFRYYYSIFISQTRAMLDEATFESAWAEGRSMTLDQAIEYALKEE